MESYTDFATEALLISVLSIVFLADLLRLRQPIRLSAYPAFWLNALHLLFFSGCFFAMASYEQINDVNSTIAKTVRSIPHYLNLFLYSGYSLIFAVAQKGDEDRQ